MILRRKFNNPLISRFAFDKVNNYKKSHWRSHMNIWSVSPMAISSKQFCLKILIIELTSMCLHIAIIETLKSIPFLQLLVFHSSAYLLVTKNSICYSGTDDRRKCAFNSKEIIDCDWHISIFNRDRNRRENNAISRKGDWHWRVGD